MPFVQPSRSSPGTAARLAALLALCLVLFFSGLSRRAIWDTDEGKHATTAKQMVRTGDWITPRFAGQPFYDKPPLFSWLVALSFSVLGFTEFAARLPAAALGLATVLATYGFGRRMLGDPAAFLGAVALASALEFVALSSVVVHDIALVCCLTVSLFSFERALAGERRRASFLAAGYAAAGLAVVAKGPVGFVIVGGVVGSFLLVRGRLAELRRLMPVRGAALALAIALPWYVAVSLRDPHYLSYFLLEKNLGSFVSRASSHPQPLYYYLPVLVLGFFPWSSFLPLTLGRLLRRPAGIDPPRLFLLLWIGFVLLFFSAATSKLPTYIVPMFPAMALLVGDLWAGVIAAPPLRRPPALVASQLCLILIVASAVPVYWLEATRHPLYDPALHRPHLLATSAILVAAVLGGSLALACRAYRSLFAINAAMLVLLLLYGLVFLLPVADAYRSTRDVARELDRRLPAGEPLAFYHEIRESALFYTDREARCLDSPGDVAAWLERPGALVVVDGTWLHDLEPLAPRFRVAERRANKVVIEALPPGGAGATSGSTGPSRGPAS